MPYKSVVKRRAAVRRSQQKARGRSVALVEAPAWPSDPAAAVIEWAADSLVVPPGHPRAGQPFELPDYLADVVRDIYRPGVREVLLLIARKNAKGAAVAVVLLAHLAGPLRRLGWRAGVASISKEKAGDLESAMPANIRGERPGRAAVPAVASSGENRFAVGLGRHPVG